MAEYVLTNAKIWVNQYDFSGDHNSLALDYNSELLDDTAMGDTNRSFLGGLRTWVLDANGFFNAIQPDLTLFTQMGLETAIISVCPTTGATGTRGYIMKPAMGAYSPGAAVGDMFAYNFHAEGTTADGGGVIQGTVVMPKTTVSASGNGTIYELGAISATQTMYAALHVFSVSAGDTIDVVIQSDTLVGFGTPDAQITFAQKAAVGSEWKSKTTAETDTFWRVNYTLGGADIAISFAVVVGIVAKTL